MKATPLSPAAALVRIEELCSRSEQCTHEVLTKLSAWGVSAEMSEKILRHLKANRFVDDNRFAEAFVRDKVVYNRWGTIKIKQALRLKRIPADIISDALSTIDPQEYKQAIVDTLRAKRRSLGSELTFTDKQKLLRHAASHGFEAAKIIEILKHPELWD